MSWRQLKHFCEGSPQYGLNVGGGEYTDEGVRLLRTTDIQEHGSLVPGKAGVFLPPDMVEPRYLLREGDLLFSRAGSLGRCFRVATTTEPVTFAGYLVRFRPLHDVDPRYLEYCAATRFFQGRIEADAVTSTISNFNAERYGNLLLPDRTQEEQRTIADFLDTETARIDALIAKKRRMIELLWTKLDAERSRCLWGDRPAVVPLMYLTPPDRRIMYGIVLPGPDVDDGVPIVKGGDVAAGLARKLCRTTREIESGYRRSRLQRGDVVFAIRGGIGDVAMVPTEVAGANITQDVARVAPAGDVEPRWLLHVLKSPEVQRQAQMRTTGATIHGLNIWDLKRLHVPDPDVEQQRFDAARLDRVERRIEAVAFRLRHQAGILQERRQALITAAVTGELEIPGAAA